MTLQDYIILDQEGNDAPPVSLTNQNPMNMAVIKAIKVSKQAASYAHKISDQAIKIVHSEISKRIAKDLIEDIIKKIQQKEFAKYGRYLLRIAYMDIPPNLGSQDNSMFSKNPTRNPNSGYLRLDGHTSN